MIATLNRIAELTDPKLIAAEFKKLQRKEAIAVAFQCAINWVDNGDFMEQVMSALGVHQQIQANTEYLYKENQWQTRSDKELLKGLDNPFLNTEVAVWVALRIVRYFADANNYKRIGAIANLALKQLEVKA